MQLSSLFATLALSAAVNAYTDNVVVSPGCTLTAYDLPRTCPGPDEVCPGLNAATQSYANTPYLVHICLRKYHT